MTTDETALEKLLELQQKYATLYERMTQLLEDRQAMGRRLETLEDKHVETEVKLGKLQERFAIIAAIGGMLLTVLSSMLVVWLSRIL